MAAWRDGAADVFLETEWKDFRMSGLEERERAVELYFTTPMTTAQVVEHLGYPTRQCLERWPAMDSRYAGHMAKPIIPLETRLKTIEPVPGSMQKRAAKQLGAGVGAVHGWVRAYRKGGMAALQPKNRNSAQGNKPADSRRRPSAADDDDAEALRRRVEEPEPGERVDTGGGGGRRKRPRRRPAAPVEQGEDPVDRPVEAGVFARLDDMLARHRAERPPTATTPGSALTSTPAPANLFDRDFTAERPNEKWLTDISEIKAKDGKGVPFAAGRLLRWQDRRIHRRLQPQRGAGQPDAGESGLDAAGERASPGAFRPWPPLPVARMARAHGTLRADALHEREGLFAGQRGRGGILRQDEDRGGPPREVGGTHPQRGARLGR